MSFHAALPLKLSSIVLPSAFAQRAQPWEVPAMPELPIQALSADSLRQLRLLRFHQLRAALLLRRWPQPGKPPRWEILHRSRHHPGQLGLLRFRGNVLLLGRPHLESRTPRPEAIAVASRSPRMVSRLPLVPSQPVVSHKPAAHPRHLEPQQPVFLSRRLPRPSCIPSDSRRLSSADRCWAAQPAPQSCSRNCPFNASFQVAYCTELLASF